MCIVYVLYVYSLNPICGQHDNKALFLVYIPSYYSISGIYYIYYYDHLVFHCAGRLLSDL